MSYLRFIAFPMLLISSIASAGDIESTLTLCAKTALGERASEKTAVNFDAAMPRKVASMSRQIFFIELANGASGQALGTVRCEVGTSGQIISAVLEEEFSSPVAMN